MNGRRVGRLLLNHQSVMTGEMIPALIEMQFIPLRVESLVQFDAFEYIGISPMFEEIPIGAIAPEYEIAVEEVDGNDGSPETLVNVTRVDVAWNQ